MGDMRKKVLVYSTIFPDDSSATHADVFYNNLKGQNMPHISAGGKSYSIHNFDKYLIEQCKVKPGNVKEAFELLKEKDAVRLSRMAGKLRREKPLERKYGIKINSKKVQTRL